MLKSMRSQRVGHDLTTEQKQQLGVIKAKKKKKCGYNMRCCSDEGQRFICSSESK